MRRSFPVGSWSSRATTDMSSNYTRRTGPSGGRDRWRSLRIAWRGRAAVQRAACGHARVEDGDRPVVREDPVRDEENGYHGGVAPQEMVVPIAVLRPSETFPDGWVEVAVDVPSWWDEPLADGSGSMPHQRERKPAKPQQTRLAVRASRQERAGTDARGHEPSRRDGSESCSGPRSSSSRRS